MPSGTEHASAKAEKLTLLFPFFAEVKPSKHACLAKAQFFTAAND